MTGDRFIPLLAALAVLLAPLWCACPLMAAPVEQAPATSCCAKTAETPTPPAHDRHAPNCPHCTDSLAVAADHPAPAPVPSALQPLAFAMPVAIGPIAAASAPCIGLHAAGPPPLSGPDIPIRCCALLN